jgi:general secretion pathway protein G
MKIKTGPALHDAGWTFMETLIVIAIVLILTSSVGFMAVQYLDRARIATARSQIDAFTVALESYYIDCGRYPAAEQGLAALWQKPVSQPVSDNWSGPYMYKNIPNDPWGNPYEYRVPGENGLAYSIRSLGADGREGGRKNDADITSWSD